MEILTYPLTLIVSLALALVFLPFVRKFAIAINLVDKPNARKVHHTAVPLAGGISLFFTSALSLLVTPLEGIFSNDLQVLTWGAAILLIVGVIDDKMDVRASLKLVIQLALAFFAFQSGIKIESMHGIFGVHELPESLQYVLSIVVITGVVNAFNLMDGIDGLAAGLAVLGLSAFTIAAFLVGNFVLISLYLALIGSLLAFLKFNFSKKQKTFMGDSGSLFLGFILVVSGISMIQSADQVGRVDVVLPIVIGVLALPVADSLRVYRRRIKNGHSPFSADKTHLHHLMLVLGLKHRCSSLLIVTISLLIIAICTLLGSTFGLTIAVLVSLVLFVGITSVLSLNMEVNNWKEKITSLETNSKNFSNKL